MLKVLLLLFFVMLLNNFANASNVAFLMPTSRVIKLKDSNLFTTGSFFNELIIPLKALHERGDNIILVMVDDKEMSVDERSIDSKYFKNKNEFNEHLKFWNQNKDAFKKIALDQFLQAKIKESSALFIPGGHSAFVDFPNNPSVSKLISFYLQQKKPLAVLCHGIAALLQSDLNIDKLKIAAFSTDEEIWVEKNVFKGEIDYYLDKKLREKGAIILQSKPFEPRVIQDKFLLSGQNPQSTYEFTRKFIQLISKGAL